MYPPQLYPGPTIQSRSAARRAAKDLVYSKFAIVEKEVFMVIILRKTCAGNINLFLVMVPKRYVPLSDHSYRSRLPYSFRWRSARSVESRGSRSHRNSVSLAGSPILSCVRAVAIIESGNDDLTIIIATLIMREYQNPWQAATAVTPM